MADQFIKAKAAEAWGPKQPLSIEEVDVMLPRKGEVLIKVVASLPLLMSICVFTRSICAKKSSNKKAVINKVGCAASSC